jgi:dodecin
MLRPRIRGSRESVECYRIDPALPIVKNPEKEPSMSIAKITEISSSSPVGFQDAVDRGIARASKTLKNISGAWVSEEKVVCDNGKITEYRVNLRISFVLED